MDPRPTLEEKAKRAYRKFGDLTPVLSGMASALAGKDMVVKAGAGTMTEGKVISIRPPISLADMPEHERRLCDERDENSMFICPACASRERIIGSLFHELGHVCFGSFEEADLSRRIKTMHEGLGSDEAKAKFERNRRSVAWVGQDNPLTVGGAFNKFLPGLINALEDVRVDTAMIEARPGVADMHRANFMELAEFGYDDGKHFSDFDLNVQMCVALIAKSKGHDYKEYFDEYVVHVADTTEIHDLVMNVPNLRKVADVMVYAFKILVVAQGHGFFVYDEAHDYTVADEPEPEGGAGGSDSDDAGADGEPSESTSGDGESSERSKGSDSPEGSAGDSEVGDDSDSGEPGRDGDSVAEPDGGEPEPAPMDERPDAEGDPAEGDDDPSGDGAGGGTDPRDSGEGSGRGDGAPSREDVPDEGKGDEPSEAPAGDEGSEVPVDPDGDADPDGDGDADGSPESSDGDVAGDEAEGVDDSADDSGAGEPGEPGADGTGAGEGVPAGAGEARLGADDMAGAADDVAGAGPLDSTGDDAPARPAEDEFGDDSTAANEAMAILTGHTDREISMSPVEESVMDRVVGSLENFDEVSVAISSARVIEVEDLTAHTFPSVLKPVPESILGPATLHMRRVFADNAFAKRDRNRRSGRLDKRVLGRRAWNDDDRLFGKKQRPGKRDYAVLIGIDASGSTAGGRRYGCTTIELELQAAKAQAELCHRTGIKFAVFAHSGTRSELAIVPIKGFDDPWNRKAEIKLAKVNAFAANLDGHTIEWYRKQLERVRATDKILMYYSDGAMPAENYTEELAILKREIRTFKSKGITLMAVGARTDDPRAHGLDTVRIDEMTDIPKVVQHLGKRLEQG